MSANKAGEQRPVKGPLDLAGAIFAFEAGELDELETIELFQGLVDTGLAWQLQGSYGRFAVQLIRQGLVSRRGEGN